MTGSADIDGSLTQPKLAGYEETDGQDAIDHLVLHHHLEAHNVFEADIQGTVTLNLTNVDSSLLESATFILKMQLILLQYLGK